MQNMDSIFFKESDIRVFITWSNWKNGRQWRTAIQNSARCFCKWWIDHMIKEWELFNYIFGILWFCSLVV